MKETGQAPGVVQGRSLGPAWKAVRGVHPDHLERMDGIRLRVGVDLEDVHQAVRWVVDPPTQSGFWFMDLPPRHLPEEVRTPSQAMAWCDEHLPMAAWIRSFGARAAS